jgi:phenylacetate-CoA ligase
VSLQETVYKRSPVLVQHALVSMRGANFRFRRSNDSAMRGTLSDLLASEALSVDERRARRSRELGEFLKTAVESTPYYRELHAAGQLPPIWREDDPLSAFAAVPLLDKARVRGSEADFYSEAIDPRRTVVGFTSGTTGSPMKTRETAASLSKRFAFVARLRTWAGLAEVVHPRRAQFTGRAICQERPPFWRRNLADNALLLSTVHLSECAAAGYADAIASFRPVLMDGYPSAMLALARLAAVQGIALPQVPVVIVSAETLTPEMRATIGSAFGATVFNQYAASEPSCFWSDCEFGNMHIHEEYGISEILDASGAPVAPGETGEVVVTSLLNPAMPLIRYRTGDLARRGLDTSCLCGRNLPLVAEVLGRTDDILYTPSRGYVGRLDPIFKGVTGIIESQVVQEDLQHIRLLVVPEPGIWGAEPQAKLLHNLLAKVGPDQQVTVELVDEIPRGANGKFRSVITRCRSDYPLDLQPY